jgi:SAM-dependent methyltransferase
LPRLPHFIRDPLNLGKSAAFLALAWLRGGPGLAVHLSAARLGAELVLKRPGKFPPGYAASLMIAPLDSVRYFELDFCFRCAAAGPEVGSYLDLSSPRLFPVLLLRERRGLTAQLLNPDASDLAVTEAMVAACGLQGRCATLQATMDAAGLQEASFDLATSISVIEHIPSPGDAEAVRLLWRAVKPGGQLVATVPCAREALEEFVDFDEYGLLQPDARGYVFGQRFYDQALLEEVFFRTCGAPRKMEIFGERNAGAFVRDRARKNSATSKPWREPYMVATEYARFPAIAELPGWGVAAMSFIKPPPA